MDMQGYQAMIDMMRHEIADVGFKELHTAEEVNEALPKAGGTSVVFINSVCGCAGGVARPAAKLAVDHGLQADHLFTVFAGQDKEATERAREIFGEYPPSSPSIAVLRNGKCVTLIHRHMIEGQHPTAVASKLLQAAKDASLITA